MGFEPKREEVRRMIAESDRDGSGTISFQTFQNVMSNKMHGRDPKEEAIKAFRLFDDDETGARSPQSVPLLRACDDDLQRIGFPFTRAGYPPNFSLSDC